MVGTSTVFDEIRLDCRVKMDSKFPVHESSVCDNASVTGAVSKDIDRCCAQGHDKKNTPCG
jgi:hypothetical protein